MHAMTIEDTSHRAQAIFTGDLPESWFIAESSTTPEGKCHLPNTRCSQDVADIFNAFTKALQTCVQASAFPQSYAAYATTYTAAADALAAGDNAYLELPLKHFLLDSPQEWGQGPWADLQRAHNAYFQAILKDLHGYFWKSRRACFATHNHTPANTIVICSFVEDGLRQMHHTITYWHGMATAGVQREPISSEILRKIASATRSPVRSTQALALGHEQLQHLGQPARAAVEMLLSDKILLRAIREYRSRNPQLQVSGVA